MHLDFRFYVKFRNEDLWKTWHQNIVIEAVSGEEYSLLEIAKVFVRGADMRLLREPVGEIFDTVTSVKKEAFCYIHDHKKSYDFFTRLADYLFSEVMKIAENDAVMIADLTDYDTDMMGDHIRYYLGGGASAVKQCVVDGPEGLDHHEIEISDFSDMLQYENLSDAQKEMLTELTGNKYPKDLLNSMSEVE